MAELLVVIAILAVVGSLVLPAVGRYVSDSRDDVTRRSLAGLRDVIAETFWQDSDRALPRPGSIGLAAGRPDHPQLRYLFINPVTEDAAVTYDAEYRLGWRGPYLVERPGHVYAINGAANFTNLYGLDGDPAVADGWGRAIVIQSPGLLGDGRRDVRLVSAGADGVLSVPPDVATSALTPTDAGDDLWISFEVRP